MQHVATLILIGLLNYAARSWLETGKTTVALLIFATTALANALAQAFVPGLDGFAYAVIASIALVLLVTKEG